MHQNPMQFISINFWNVRLNFSSSLCSHHLHNAAKFEMRNADRSKVMHFKWVCIPSLHALTNVRQRHWFTLLANLISFIRFKVRTKSVSFEGFVVIASLHMVNDGFHLPTFPVCSLKMCTFKWIYRNIDEVLSNLEWTSSSEFHFCHPFRADA